MSSRRPFSRLLPALGLAVGFILACGGGDEEEAPANAEPMEEPAPEAAPEPEPEPEPAAEDKSVAVEREAIEHKFSFTLKVKKEVKWDKRKAEARAQAAREIKKRGWDEVKSVNVERRGDCGDRYCKHSVSVVAVEKKLQFAE